MPENGEEKKMKKFLVLIVFAMIIIFALSCGNEKKSSGYELALITDVGTIDDRSFNQGSWEGLSLIHISEPTRLISVSRMPSSA